MNEMQQTRKKNDFIVKPFFQKTVMIAKDLDEAPIIYTLWLREINALVASALIMHDYKGHAILWIIEVDEKHQGQGYGLELLKQICSRYVIVETQWLNKAGRKLCEKAGFCNVENNDRLMIWER